MDPLPAHLLQKTPAVLRATSAADKKIPPSFGMPSEATDLHFSVRMKKELRPNEPEPFHCLFWQHRLRRIT